MKNYSRHFVAATCALAAFSPVEMMAQKQPNFVIIVADDMGYGDVGIYGKDTGKGTFALQSVRMADARQHGSAHIAEQKDNIFLLGGERLCDLYRCHRFPTAGAAPDRQHTAAVILLLRFLCVALKDAGLSEIHPVTSLSGISAVESAASPSSMGSSSGSAYSSSMSASCASMNCLAPSVVPR